LILVLASIATGCGDGSRGSNTDVSQIPAEGPWNFGVALPTEPQSDGDPVRGREILLGGDFMTCGLPFRLWNNPVFQQIIAAGFGGSAAAPRIADRPGKNADMPYFINVFTAENGAEVINANCLLCHGSQFNGEVVVGLGDPTVDFTNGAGGGNTGLPLSDELLNLFGLNGPEKDQLRKTYQRAAALGPLTNMRTVGMNPAEMFAVILMVHHDRDTLAWSDEEVTPLTIYDHDGNVMNNDDVRITSDPPPWWRAHKKNALFYNGMARGDHRGSMAYATSVCVDDIERAREVDELFKDIHAFIRTIRPPAYPFAVDAELAEEGHRLFVQNCAGCHGTYSQNEDEETYPNLLIPLPVIGTDPVVAEAGVVHAPQLVEWYNASYYGSVTRMEPNDPFPGYMPPPLDGIWATAPYLHNGSVPNVELMLNSSARPAYWKRVDYDSTNFDEEALGWPFMEVAYPQALAPAAERKFIYDTTYFSQSNRGHTFGDHLTPEERRAVIEYLKTL
jgi:mono/diheme cytochrome c family protein